MAVMNLSNPELPDRLNGRDPDALEAIVDAYLPQYTARRTRGVGFSLDEGQDHKTRNTGTCGGID